MLLNSHQSQVRNCKGSWMHFQRFLNVFFCGDGNFFSLRCVFFFFRFVNRIIYFEMFEQTTHFFFSQNLLKWRHRERKKKKVFFSGSKRKKHSIRGSQAEKKIVDHDFLFSFSIHYSHQEKAKEMGGYLSGVT